MKTYNKLQLKKRLNEEVLKSDDGYYVDIVGNGIGMHVKDFLEAFDNLPPKGYDNAQLNVGPGGKIFGQVSGIQLDEYDGHKFVCLTLSPYKNLDYSIPNTTPKHYTVQSAKQRMKAFDPNTEVLIKSKNFYGSGIHNSDIILSHVFKIQMSESDGFFIRPNTYYHVIQDNAKKNMDLVMQMKKLNSSLTESISEAEMQSPSSNEDIINTAFSTLLCFLSGNGKKVLKDDEWLLYIENDIAAAIQQGLFKPSFEDKQNIKAIQEQRVSSTEESDKENND